MGTRTFRLVPLEQKSANEQLWEAARFAVAYEINRCRLKFSSNEEKEELFQELLVKTVKVFLRRMVFDKLYDRRFSFWQNVYSCCWSSSNYVITKWMDNIKRRISAVPLSAHYATSEDNIIDNLADTGTSLPYKSTYWHNNRTYAKMTSMASKLKFVKADYEDYRMLTELTGVTTMPFEKWFWSSGYAADEALVDYLYPDPKAEKAKKRQYERDRRKRIKEKKACRKYTKRSTYWSSLSGSARP